MDNLIITLFIAIANIVAMLLIYHSFDKNLEKTKKILYTMIAMGVMYILILIVYSLSSIGLEKQATSESKDMITFTFVPVNAIIILPILIRAFNKRKNKEISTDQLNKRAIIMLIIAGIILISEFFYFKDIQKGIIEMVNKRQENQNAISNNEVNTESGYDITIYKGINNSSNNKKNNQINYVLVNDVSED